jgi:hypothetical protein
MTEGKKDGKAAGGHARAKVLPPERLSAIARAGARARWESPVVQATHGSEDRPLRIGDIELPCYVLEDDRRVLQQTAMLKSLSMSFGGSYSTGGSRLAKFATQNRLQTYVSADLIERTANPIKFKTPTGATVYGYEANILAELCEAILAARAAGVLQKQQAHVAERAEILVRGFARVGIIALVDEATGYQFDRAANALARILEAFIVKELQPWVQTFPTDFYRELFRLRGLDYPSSSVRRPQYFGILTNDLVYKRLAPGVLTELKKVTPKNEAGRPKHKLFQHLTGNVGYPKLREHLGATVAVMRLSSDYHDFLEKMDRLYPRYGETLELPLDYHREVDDGKGI